MLVIIRGAAMHGNTAGTPVPPRPHHWPLADETAFAPPPRPLRPVRGLATAVLALLGLDTLAGGALAVVSDPLATAAEIVGESAVPLLSSSALLVVLTLSRYLVRFGLIVVFLVWLVRVRLNAETLTRVPHRWFKIFIVLGWALPVVGWWIPKQIVDDIWAASRPGGVRGESIGRQRHSWLVWAWWIAWLLAFWVVPLSSVALRSLAGRPPEEVGALVGFGLDPFTWVPTLLAAALLALVVVRITRFQETRAVADGR
ncbi:DUF4328 domain-containing protein [Streptosporangium saharense]|uniref:DUF4328 domain-containing protein n=1 Tax=Streptosporangium saharense TaxID=1706840 RepID=UPI00342CCE02